VDDNCVGATALSQVTNDAAWFELATYTARRWGGINLQDRLTLSAVPWLQAPMIISGTMVAGSVTIDSPGVDATYSMFIPFVVTRGGTTGSLSVSNRNPTGGTGSLGAVTIISSSSTDTSVIGALRFDLPH
ncbi:MAG: hypothetical protein ACREMY_12960, partial [bacterium]